MQFNFECHILYDGLDFMDILRHFTDCRFIIIIIIINKQNNQLQIMFVCMTKQNMSVHDETTVYTLYTGG